MIGALSRIPNVEYCRAPILLNFRGIKTSDSYAYIQLDINIFTAHLGNPTDSLDDIEQLVLNWTSMTLLSVCDCSVSIDIEDYLEI